MNEPLFPQTLFRICTRMIFTTVVATAAACGGGDGGGNTRPPPPTTCTPGTSTGCPSGQVCSAAGVCESVGVQGTLAINAPGARGCEILLESTTAKVLGADFGTASTGVFRARAPRYAVAVASASNSDLGADAIRLTVEGEPSAITVRNVACYDNAGAPIANASAALN